MHGNSDSLADRPGKSPVRFRAPCATERHRAPGNRWRRARRGAGTSAATVGSVLRRRLRGCRAHRASRRSGLGRHRRWSGSRRASRLPVRAPAVALERGAQAVAGASVAGVAHRRLAAPGDWGRPTATRCGAGASRPISARPGPRRRAAKGVSGFRRGEGPGAAGVHAAAKPPPIAGAPDRACGGLGGGSPARPARRARAYRPAGLGMR